MNHFWIMNIVEEQPLGNVLVLREMESHEVLTFHDNLPKNSIAQEKVAEFDNRQFKGHQHIVMHRRFTESQVAEMFFDAIHSDKQTMFRRAVVIAADQSTIASFGAAAKHENPESLISFIGGGLAYESKGVLDTGLLVQSFP